VSRWIRGALLAVGLANLLTRHGLANGVALLMLASLAADIVRMFRATLLFAGNEGMPPPFLAILLPIATLAISLCLLRAGARLRLVPEEGTTPAGPGTRSETWLVLRQHPAGVIPLAAAEAVLLFPQNVMSMIRPEWHGEVLPPWVQMVLTPIVVIGASLLYASWTFNGEDRQGKSGDARCLERIQERISWTGAGLLALLGALSFARFRCTRAMSNWTRISLVRRCERLVWRRLYARRAPAC
jgi:hypothetical protein